jgi:hypothetical protein
MTAVERMLEDARVYAGVFFLCAVLGGCATVFPQTAELRGEWPAGLPQEIELSEVPFFPQTEYQCGPAALATALAHLSLPVTADDLVKDLYIPARKGTVQVEMLATPRRHGIVSYTLAPRMADVLREIAAGNPVIVLQNYSTWPILKFWHYAVAIGFDAVSGTVQLRSGEEERLSIPLGIFEYTWKDGGNWAMVVVPPDRIPATADRARYFDSIAALERAGQPAAAAVAYEQFLTRWPDDLGASVGLANAYYAIGHLERTEDALRRALDRHPGSVVVLNNLAHTLSERGRSKEALELIERAAADGPHAKTVSETRALILQRLAQ